MKSVKIQLRLPEDLHDVAARQAAQSGVSLNLFLAMAVAFRASAQAEAERYFTARGSRTTPQQAKTLQKRPGTASVVRDDDHLSSEYET
jgi:hypothetical protein